MNIIVTKDNREELEHYYTVGKITKYICGSGLLLNQCIEITKETRRRCPKFNFKVGDVVYVI